MLDCVNIKCDLKHSSSCEHIRTLDDPLPPPFRFTIQVFCLYRSPLFHCLSSFHNTNCSVFPSYVIAFEWCPVLGEPGTSIYSCSLSTHPAPAPYATISSTSTTTTTSSHSTCVSKSVLRTTSTVRECASASVSTSARKYSPFQQECATAR